MFLENTGLKRRLSKTTADLTNRSAIGLAGAIPRQAGAWREVDLLGSRVICLGLVMGRSTFTPNPFPLLSLQAKPDFLWPSWDAGPVLVLWGPKAEILFSPSCWKPRSLFSWRKREPGIVPRLGQGRAWGHPRCAGWRADAAQEMPNSLSCADISPLGLSYPVTQGRKPSEESPHTLPASPALSKHPVLNAQRVSHKP